MMNLQERINADMISALKAKDVVKRDLLRVIKGELEQAEQAGKTRVELTDADVIKVLKKGSKNLKEVLAAKPDDETAKAELEIIESYLPQQMTEEQIGVAVKDIITKVGATTMADMGVVFKSFNTNFAGKADGKVVSMVIKSLLS